MCVCVCVCRPKLIYKHLLGNNALCVCHFGYIVYDTIQHNVRRYDTLVRKCGLGLESCANTAASILY